MQYAAIQVHVFPAQPKRLALPKSQRQGEGPACAVAPLVCHVQQALDLLDAVRLDLFFGQLRCLGQQHRVAC